jgi:prepilin-type N-terminal cleavage/methylation domain-containing protein
MFVKVKKNNGGFSLVELIVVIAISVVLIGAATISIRSVMGVEVKQCARNIESIINKTRVTSMGKDSAVLKIYKASDGAYYYKMTINGTESDPSKIGKSRIEVYYSMNDDYTVRDVQLCLATIIIIHGIVYFNPALSDFTRIRFRTIYSHLIIVGTI